MGQRTQLHDLLKDLLGSSNVYFQPPANVHLSYPCIIYTRDRTSTTFADGNPYRRTKKYQIIVIDQNPDSEIPDKIGALPMCVHDRFYASDSLNHDVFTLFF